MAMIAKRIAFDEIVSPVLHQLIDYWMSLKEAETSTDLPDRAALDPLKFKFAMSSVFLIEVLEDPYDFLHKLGGEDVTRGHGYQIVGTKISTARFEDEEQRREAHDFYHAVVESRKPMGLKGSLRFVVGFDRPFESVYLPMTDKARGISDKVGIIFGALDVQPEDV